MEVIDLSAKKIIVMIGACTFQVNVDMCVTEQMGQPDVL